MGVVTATPVAAPPTAWNRWGADEERGALYLIGPEQVRCFSGWVRTGEVLRLSQLLSPKTPVPSHRCGLQHCMCAMAVTMPRAPDTLGASSLRKTRS